MTQTSPHLSPTIHACAVLVGAKAVLIRGPSGSGKSELALALLQAAQAGQLPFARLVADDRAHVEAVNGRLLVRPASALKGLLELRGSGIHSIEAEPVAAIGCVVDLAAQDAVRLPEKEACEAVIEGIRLPRLAVASGQEALPLVLLLLHTLAGSGPGAVRPP
ncbi:MAG TPA: serine kinase [Xanthobacteraceae bacterium]|nr:serine kinase [Xanthobacteraceae bacterium]